MKKQLQFKWVEYLQQNRTDIKVNNFKGWCKRNRPKKQVFNTEQELLQAISLYDNRRKTSKFNWQQYLKENRSGLSIESFENWCQRNRLKRSIFDTEQELLEALQLYDNRQTLSKFNWQQYLKENRPDINMNNFALWCNRNRPKRAIFDIEQELIQTLQLYDDNKRSKFNWQKCFKENRTDINIDSFKSWCNRNRPKKQVFNTEQELLQAILLYDNRENKCSDFKWRQYLKENRTDINIINFSNWCGRYRTKKYIFDTEQELIETILLYDITKKYIVRKTKYQGIYNLTERETGLKFNFYRLEDMIGLL